MVPTRQELAVAREQFHDDDQLLREPVDVMLHEDTAYSLHIRPVLIILSFSPWGNMARIGMQKLITYQNSYIFYENGTIIWINFTSCFIMGLANSCVEFWDCFNKGNKIKLNFKQMPLHSGVTAGFCACMSTLSALLMELFYKTSNNTKLKVPNHGYGVMEFFAIILGQLGLCFFGLALGTDLGILVDTKLVPHLRPYLNCHVSFILERIIMLSSLAFVIVNIVLTIILTENNWYREDFSLAILLGLPATFLRYQLMFFNDRLKWLPLGTLLSNILATLLLSTLQILMHGYISKTNHNLIIPQEKYQWVLQSLGSGFGGSLSTIAALCYEVQHLSVAKHRYYYVMITFCVCWSIVILIVGSYNWAVGLRPV